jgi:hypothetical protein
VGKQSILNTCWRTYFEYLSGKKNNTENNKSGFDYIVEKTVNLNTSVDNKGYELWRGTNDLGTVL